METSTNTNSHIVTLCVTMGVSGCGKTTIGESLANKLSAPFLEGDTFHPKVNVDKMSNGIPLNDDDRWPWLSLIRDKCRSLANEFRTDKNRHCSYLVITCSALKKSYRDFLRQTAGVDRVVFIYAKGSFDMIFSRISQRQNHFMKPDMLNSQFITLESPEEEKDVVSVDISQHIDIIIEQIMDFLQ